MEADVAQTHATGGKLLEALHVFVPGVFGHVVRLWVVHTYDAGDPTLAAESCVYVRHSDHLPRVGEQVWWYRGVVYYGECTKQLQKVGWSFPAPSMTGQE